MNICILTPRYPFPENGGDVLRINNVARYLKSKGHYLFLLSFIESNQKIVNEEYLYDEIITVSRNKIESLFNSLLFIVQRKPIQCGYYYSRRFLKIFKDVIEEKDIDIYIPHLIRMVPYLEKTKLNDKTIVEMTDALSKTYTLSSQSKVKSIKKLIYNIEKKLVKAYEESICKNFKKVVLVSEKDVEYLRNCNSNLYCFSNGVSLSKKIDKYNPNKICFIGNMRTLQNQDAVLHFVNNIFPIIKKENHDAYFVIVGAEPSENILKLHDGKNIFVTGFVESVEDIIRDSCLAVAPVKIAAGIQNKVLIAMGCGVPVVLTSLIANAIPELDNYINCCIEDNNKSFAEKCLKIMKESDFREMLAMNAYKMVEANYSWKEKLNNYELLE